MQMLLFWGPHLEKHHCLFNGTGGEGENYKTTQVSDLMQVRVNKCFQRFSLSYLAGGPTPRQESHTGENVPEEIQFVPQHDLYGAPFHPIKLPFEIPWVKRFTF